ncbi:MAG TPA: tetratricopeptide repeat protein [Burkholderiaceae bacterium]
MRTEPSATTAAAQVAASAPAAPAALTADMMFELLSADMAMQNGEWREAYAKLMTVAQQARDPRLARRAMEAAVAGRDENLALLAIRLWREYEPASDEALQYYVGFAVLNGKLDELRPVLALRLQQADPAVRGLAMLQVQRFLTRAEDKKAAFSLLDDLMAPYRNTLEARLVLAQGAHAAGDSARAMREASSAREIAPLSELALLTLAQVTPEPARAQQLLADFLDTHPDAREVRTAYARMLLEQKQYGQARRQLETILAAQPGNVVALHTLGVLCLEAGDLEAAERYLKSYMALLDAHPDSERDPSQVLGLLAQIAQERGDSKAAEAWMARIEQAGGRGAQYFAAHVKRAAILAKRDLAAARKLLASYNPDDSAQQARLLLTDAQLLRNAQQSAQAYAVLDSARKRFPDDADVLYDYAIAAEGLNKLDAMEAALRRVMELTPENHHAYNALGYAFAEHNVRLPEALQLITTALEMAPADPFIMDSMGWVQFRMGRLQDAEQTLRRAYGLQPDAEIAVHLGEVLWQRGQAAEAQELWRKAQAKDPNNPALRSTLVRLQVKL